MAIRWLIEVGSSIPESERRRARLLAWLHLFMIPLTITVLALTLTVNFSNIPRRNLYVGLVLSLFVLIAVAFWLNRAGYYRLSAGLTIASALIGSWGSMILDPAIIQGDIIPLAYMAVSVMLASILLSPLFTISLATIQIAAFVVLLFIHPDMTKSNWPSLLILILFISGLSILANIITQRDLAQIDNQARQLALNEQRLREQSIRDYLTNLFNRRYLEETLEREMGRATRKQYSLGVIMLDIDHFKRVNDTLGHAAGDALLRGLGNFLLTKIRQSDIGCRYGGEEFVLILPEAGCDETRERAEQLRADAKELIVMYKDQPLPQITISLGVAVFPDNGSTVDMVLQSADNALYQAKLAGRDRVIVSDGSSISQ